MLSAEASTTKATAISSMETLGLANSSTVALPDTRSLEPVALTLTGPSLSHHRAHLSGHEEENHKEKS